MYGNLQTFPNPTAEPIAANTKAFLEPHMSPAIARNGGKRNNNLTRASISMLAELPAFFQNYFGRVGAKEQAQVYSEVKAGANPSNEYFVMLVISSIIATIGLLTNSVAAIIGAMLVSPLFTPVIGLSLGAVKGDFLLFRGALEAEVKGVFLALAIVILTTLFIPNAGVTGEI